jgi:hypothetical protein
MQSINITQSKETPEWLRVKLEFVRAKIELQFRVYEADHLEEVNTKEFIIKEQPVAAIEQPVAAIEQPVAAIEESPEEKKRRKAKEYYYANKDRLREDAKRRYRAKKVVPEPVHDISDNLSELSEEESLVFDYDPSLSIHENSAIIEQRQNYYQNHLTEIRQYYQDNKDRIAKRQQTDEVRAKFREQYKARRTTLTPEQIKAKNAIAVAQRKVRDAKLRAKYPGMKLKAAKAAEKARREVI